MPRYALCCCTGIVLRLLVIKLTSPAWFKHTFMRYFGPCALLGLLYTIVVMFAAQDIISQAGNVARVAVPMLIYFLVMFAVSLGLSYWCRMSYAFSVTQAFTAAVSEVCMHEWCEEWGSGVSSWC